MVRLVHKSFPSLFEKPLSPELRHRILDVVKLSERHKSWINVAERMAELGADGNISLKTLNELARADEVRRGAEHNFYDTAEAAFMRFHSVYHTKQFAPAVPKTLHGFSASSGGSEHMFFDRDRVLAEIRQFIRRFQGNNFLDDFCDGLFFEYGTFPHELRTILTSADVLKCFSDRVCKDIIPTHIERRYGDIVRQDPQAYVYPRLGALGTMAFFPEQFVASLESLLDDLVCFGLSWVVVRPLFEKGLIVPESALEELRTVLCGKAVPMGLRKLAGAASVCDLIELLWMGTLALRKKELMSAGSPVLALPLAS